MHLEYKGLFCGRVGWNEIYPLKGWLIYISDTSFDREDRQDKRNLEGSSSFIISTNREQKENFVDIKYWMGGIYKISIWMVLFDEKCSACWCWFELDQSLGFFFDFFPLKNFSIQSYKRYAMPLWHLIQVRYS